MKKYIRTLIIIGMIWRETKEPFLSMWRTTKCKTLWKIQALAIVIATRKREEFSSAFDINLSILMEASPDLRREYDRWLARKRIRIHELT